ncbi:MAG: hypothetical protein AAF662_06275 [Pseudomonadota bacterium]
MKEATESEQEIGPAEKSDPPGNEVPPSDRVAFREISPAIEFMCWVVVALTPMLRLVNGPPVTDDQAAIQIALVAMAVGGAFGLRLYNWRTRV